MQKDPDWKCDLSEKDLVALAKASLIEISDWDRYNGRTWNFGGQQYKGNNDGWAVVDGVIVDYNAFIVVDVGSFKFKSSDSINVKKYFCYLLDKLSLPYYDLEIKSIKGIEEFDFEKLFEFMSDANGYFIYFDIWGGKFKFNSAGRGYYVGQGYEIHQNYDDGFKLQIVINGCASIYNREKFKELQSFL